MALHQKGLCNCQHLLTTPNLGVCRTKHPTEIQQTFIPPPQIKAEERSGNETMPPPHLYMHMSRLYRVFDTNFQRILVGMQCTVPKTY